MELMDEKEQDCIWMECVMTHNYETMYRCMNCGQVLTKKAMEGDNPN